MQSKADKSSTTAGNSLYDLTNEDRNDGDAKVETTLSTPVTTLLIGSSHTTLTHVTPSPTSHSIETARELEIPIIDLTLEPFNINQNIDGLEDNLRRIVEVVCVTAEQAEELVANGGLKKTKEKRARESEVERLVRGSTSMLRAKRVRK